MFTDTAYDYDHANRLVDVNGVTYTWDNNGNLLNDGVNIYTYDSANRLKTISGASTATFSYNGLGDRLTQNGVNYTLDLNAGLTQVLNDGTNQYLYGVGRIAQVNTNTEYFLSDALGSIRQLTDATGEITYASAYDPYGVTTQAYRASQTSYGFTGEFTDPSGLVYLRARYYSPGIGRFQTRDTWMGVYNRPLSLNRWIYGYDNPVNYTDPTGLIPCSDDQSMRYCVFESGGFIDIEHFRAKKGRTESLIKRELPSQFGKHFGQIPFDGSLGSPLPEIRFASYLTNLPLAGLPKEQLGRIALGMIMDSEYRFEAFQGIDPLCYTFLDRSPLMRLLNHYCSSFSNEDLPSDYLGIVSEIKGYSLTDMLAPNLLGPDSQSNQAPDGYRRKFFDYYSPFGCSLGICTDWFPTNDCATFKIFDPTTKKYTNRPWPSDLIVEPFGFGLYWGRSESDFTIIQPPVILPGA